MPQRHGPPAAMTIKLECRSPYTPLAGFCTRYARIIPAMLIFSLFVLPRRTLAGGWHMLGSMHCGRIQVNFPVAASVVEFAVRSGSPDWSVARRPCGVTRNSPGPCQAPIALWPTSRFVGLDSVGDGGELGSSSDPSIQPSSASARSTSAQDALRSFSPNPNRRLSTKPGAHCLSKSCSLSSHRGARVHPLVHAR